jgi:replicative DNA helicase
MDRPAQARRSLARMAGPEHRDTLEERLIVWEGPPPRDFAQHPGTLLEMAEQAEADCVVIDSLKDAALKLTEDDVGSAYNRARQLALANGVDLLELHHQRKPQGGDKKPNTLADVYGSTWITAGCGSCVLLWGNPGDPVVSLTHLKQPLSPFGPLKVDHDHDRGVTTILEGVADPLVMLRNAGPNGLSAEDVARVLKDGGTPSENDRRQARRKLGRLVDRGHAVKREGVRRSGGADPDKWVAVEEALEDDLAQAIVDGL